MFSAFGQNIMLGRAILNGKTIAAVLIVCHGICATYQAGWTTKRGKDTAAHNVLLWQSVIELKKRDIHTLDLGGVNDKTAKNVKRFKEGMGGQLVTLAGQYS